MRRRRHVACQIVAETANVLSPRTDVSIAAPSGTVPSQDAMADWASAHVIAGPRALGLRAVADGPARGQPAVARRLPVSVHRAADQVRVARIDRLGGRHGSTTPGSVS